MEFIKIQEEIYNKTKLLEHGRSILDKLANEKAIAIVEYEKALAYKELELGDQKEIEIEGRIYKKPSASVLKDVAKGLIADREGLQREIAEYKYKNAVAKMKAIESEMNGLQSINKYSDKI